MRRKMVTKQSAVKCPFCGSYKISKLFNTVWLPLGYPKPKKLYVLI